MKRIIVALTGASGACYAVRILEILKEKPDVETHLVVSPAGARTLKHETDLTIAELKALADVCYSHRDIGAAISSGSFLTDGMIVAPCSVKTLSGIANSYDEDLIVRAADVCLKERRPVVLMLRETPLHAGHIQLMADAARNGAILMPPVPAFYQRPTTIAEIVDHTACRALDLVGIRDTHAPRWQG
jgi:4-hydroxy-3-polyprenylbenzoate decarboxylase